MILGICEGLQHLHKEKHIIHENLNPSNILLGDDMVPKITDFCLSEFYYARKTWTDEIRVARKYCAPEWLNGGKISAKSDIYSLGLVIRELVTGRRTKVNINNELRKWRHRWNKSGRYMPLWHQQVTKCLELASSCVHEDPTQRPFMWDIIRELKESDRKSSLDWDDMLGVEPLEIHFPSELDTQQSRLIQFTNDTDHYIAFMILPPRWTSLAYSTQPNKDIVPPRSMYSVTITLQEHKEVPRRLKHKFTVLSTRVDKGVTATDISKDMFSEGEGKVVDEVILNVIFGKQ